MPPWLGEPKTGWGPPASFSCTLVGALGQCRLNLGGPSRLVVVVVGVPGLRQHLGGASRSRASRINGYISSLDAGGPHLSGKLAGLGLACLTLPEALRGEVTACASQRVSRPESYLLRMTGNGCQW